MGEEATSCPSCGAGLSNTQGLAVVKCQFCGTDVRIRLTAVETMQASLDRRREVEPIMNLLMDRYADLLGSGQKAEAIRYYEAFTYLVLWIAHDVDELDELEAMATPLMEEAARQLDIPYAPPRNRQQRVTWASVRALAE